MVLDLSFGKRCYDFLGSHRHLYRSIRWGVCLGREDYLQARAISKLAPDPGDTVLDLACGTGVNFPDLLARVGPSGRVIAVDYSDGMLEAARAKARNNGWRNVEFIQTDATILDLPRESLDGALCTFGLSAMPGEREALERVARALKPGAGFVSLDAKAFTGQARVLNPVLGPVFKYTTNWNYHKNVVESLREIFGELDVEEYNGGCNYLAVGVRRSGSSSR